MNNQLGRKKKNVKMTALLRITEKGSWREPRPPISWKDVAQIERERVLLKNESVMSDNK